MSPFTYKRNPTSGGCLEKTIINIKASASFKIIITICLTASATLDEHKMWSRNFELQFCMLVTSCKLAGPAGPKMKTFSCACFYMCCLWAKKKVWDRKLCLVKNHCYDKAGN